MAKTPLNFKSGAAYKKYLAFGHSTGVFDGKPGNQVISIAGKPHPVNHQNSSNRNMGNHFHRNSAGY